MKKKSLVGWTGRIGFPTCDLIINCDGEIVIADIYKKRDDVLINDMTDPIKVRITIEEITP